MSNVIIFNPYNSWLFHFNYEIPIYYNLKSRGIDVKYLSCGFEHSDCDMYQRAVIGDRPKNACLDCKITTNNLMNATGISQISIKQYLNQVKFEKYSKKIDQLTDLEIKEFYYEEYNLYSIARASVFTHLRVNALKLNDFSHFSTLKNYMKNALSTLIAGEAILEEQRPEAALVFNGRMAAPRAFVELCKSHGVRIVTHERGFTRSAVSLVVDDICSSFKNYDDIKSKKLKTPLIEYQIEYVRNWLNDRRNGRNLNWKNYQELNTKQYVREKKITHWVLFTSSMDEISSSENIISPFKDQFDWIEKTVDLAKSQSSEVHLTIRVHPNSSSSISTGQNSEEREYFSKLKQSLLNTNIDVIESFDQTDSYSLLDAADLVLCYASTIALEALLSGKKTFLAANCEWSRCGGLFTIETCSEYEVELKTHTNINACQLEIEKIIEGFRFVYHVLHSTQITFPFIEQSSKSENRLITNDISDFFQGVYPELDMATDIILGKREIVEPNVGYFGLLEMQSERMSIMSSAPAKNAPLFSIVITNYNYGEYIEACIGSVLMQTEKEFEIIVVDDGSTDDSRNIINRVISANAGKDIKVLFQENSGQPAIARNNGIKISSGKYILPLDADDMISPDYLAGCKKIIEERPEVNLIYADSLHVYPDRVERHAPGKFTTGHLSTSNQIVVASLYTKLLWKKVSGYSTNVRGYEDWDLWLKMSLAGAITAYYNGLGLLYNCKGSGLLSEAQMRHQNLFASIILNNRLAYQNNLQAVRWAEKIIEEKNINLKTE